MRPIIASLKFMAFFVLCLVFVPPQVVVLCITKDDKALFLPMIWMRCVCFIFRIRVFVEGNRNIQNQVIVMSNHLSYLDIPAIGSVIPHSFVSKADVAKWPIFGFLAGLRLTAYVVRGSKDPELASKGVEEYLMRGESLIVFPEGTSTDGQDVLDFKTGIFARAIDCQVNALKIQPTTIKVISADNREVKTQDDRDIYAWHRDMTTELPAHLWHFACSRGAHLKIIFHPCIEIESHHDRKTLAKDTHKAVSNGHRLLKAA
ncbi:MAG: lysophospholipid acyltransferase family protein [Bdellovibrionales bacterium]